MNNKWEDKKDILINLIEVQHLPYEQIGKMFNCTGGYIRKVAKKLGINLVPRRKINENETFNKGKGKKNICLNCGCEFNVYESTKNRKYCSNKCQLEYEYKIYINRWKNGEETGLTIYGDVSNYVRRYLFDKYNCSCQICGWSEKNPVTKKVPLEIHHIDGNCLNNKEENLQLLCPNHHSLTPTFGSLNKVSGRKTKRIKT